MLIIGDIGFFSRDLSVSEGVKSIYEFIVFVFYILCIRIVILVKG